MPRPDSPKSGLLVVRLKYWSRHISCIDNESSVSHLRSLHHMPIGINEDRSSYLESFHPLIRVRVRSDTPFHPTYQNGIPQKQAGSKKEDHSRPPTYPSLSYNTISPNKTPSSTPILLSITLPALFKKKAALDPEAPAPIIATLFGRVWLSAPW